MGPCARCGQQTEADADFCPACGGYAAPGTVYSYAPGRLGRTSSELRADLADLAVSVALAADDRPAVLAPDHGRAAPRAATPLAGSWADTLAARMKASTERRGRGRWVAAATALLVVVVAAGAVALVLTRSGPASPPAAQAGRISPAARPTASTAGPTTPTVQVSVAASAASLPDQAAVLSFLTGYFTAINDHDFGAYQQLFSSAQQSDLSATQFSTGYGTTTDSAITLHNIAVLSSGELAAQVSFISHQQPALSPTGTQCTAWNVSLYLQPQGGTYLLVQPPASYGASYTACS
jgi:hypothetical protein